MSNDRSYLAALQDYYAAHRALPSYASIGALLGLRSKSSVAALVARLKLAGFVESTPDRLLAPPRPDQKERDVVAVISVHVTTSEGFELSGWLQAGFGFDDE